MAKFSPTDAAFAGFRFARQRPATLLIWSAYLMVVVAVALLALFDLGGDSMTNLVTASQTGSFDVAQFTKLSDDLLPASFFCLLLMVVFGAVLSTAILRVYCQPGAHPWGGLKFGGDELRLLGASVMVLAALFLADSLLGLVAGVAGTAGIPAAPILLLGFLLVLALQVRLSLATVVSMTEKRISLARSWLLTGKHFWSLLGAYVLLIAITLVMLVLIAIVFGALMALVAMAGGGGNPVAMLMTHDFQGLNPIMVGLYTLMNLAQIWVGLMFMVGALAIGVEAWRAFKVDVPAP